MRLLPHATTVAVVVENGITVTWYSPLHHQVHQRLWRHHTVVCWRGPRPLPLIDRWSPQTLTPFHGVIGGDCVSSTVGVAPTGLYRPKGPRHRAVTGRREEKDDKCHIMVVTDPVGVSVIYRTTHIFIGPWGRP
jgi:hypothetical protein